MGSWDVTAAIAREQYGVVERSQLTRAGVPKSTVTAWAATGRLHRVQPRVYALDAWPVTWEQRVLAATLATGGVAHLRSAARLWDLWPDVDDVEVLVERGVAATLRDAKVHWTSSAAETTVRHRVPVTTPPYTLVMLGSVASRAEVEDVVARALGARLVTARALDGALARLSRPGVRGTRVLRAILADWELGQRPPDSVLETRMLTLLRKFKVPKPEFQHIVRVRGRFLARVDFAYPSYRLAIEVDGGEHHASAADRARDAARRNRLVAAGWAVMVFTWAQVVREGHDVAAAVLGQLSSCRAQAGMPASVLQDRG